jgi:hypothetical protein
MKAMFISLLFSIDREPDDSPDITFCAVNNKTLYGWKQTKEELESTHVTAVDQHCNKPNIVEHADVCVERGRFNLAETIKIIRVHNLEIQKLIVIPQKSFWRQDIFYLFLGTVIESVW